MVEAAGYMIRSNGKTGGQTAWINIYRESQNWGANTTTYRIQAQYRGNGNTAFQSNASGNSWSVSTGWGHYWSGNFAIPSGQGGNTFWLLDTTFTVTHDAAGNSPAFNVSVSISSTNTAYIGSGSAGTTEGAPPRIPKRPSPPGTPSVTNNLPTSLTLSWAGSSDNAGSGIDGYLLRYWPNPEGSGPYTDHSFQNNTSRTVTGLTPGKEYRFVVYAHNGAVDNGGYSNMSGALVVRTRAGIRIKVDGVWKLAIPYVKVDGTWKMAIPFVKDGGTWKMTS